jgi:hypothetical protein
MLTASIIGLMKETVSTSETSVSFYQTTLRNIPEDYHLHTRRRENLKSHKTTKLTLPVGQALCILGNVRF